MDSNWLWMYKEASKSLIFVSTMFFEKFKNKTPLNMTPYTVFVKMAL